MTTIRTQDPLAIATVGAIHSGDIDHLRQLLADNPGLADVRLGTTSRTALPNRSLLRVAADWPGHFPNVAATIAALVTAGADVNARFHGPHDETPLHWAASSDDVDALTALLDAGADIDAEGGVIAGGTPMRDATAFAQSKLASSSVSRGTCHLLRPGGAR